MLVKLIILLVGIAIWCAIGGHGREGRGFENGWLKMENGKFGMMKGFDYDKKDLKKLSTGELATAQANMTIYREQATKMAALQDDYMSMQKFIQRGDMTNAMARIDVVIKELNQLKIDLPKLPTLQTLEQK